MELVLVVLALAGGILIGIAVGWRAGHAAGVARATFETNMEWLHRPDPSDSAGA